jgi:hypothetical protein
MDGFSSATELKSFVQGDTEDSVKELKLVHA